MKKTTSPLLPLIKLCQQKKHRGLKSSVQSQLVAMGYKANWGQVSDWLHPVEAMRRVPRQPIMAALLAIQESVNK